jgi:VanZ family protein
MKKSLYLWLAILWMALIWTLSSMPAKELPEFKLLGIDKLAHFAVYFVWGMLINMHLRAKRGNVRIHVIVFTLMIISAALDENHQRFIPGRSVSIYDFLANALGLLTAWSFGRLFMLRSNHD